MPFPPQHRCAKNSLLLFHSLYCSRNSDHLPRPRTCHCSAIVVQSIETASTIPPMSPIVTQCSRASSSPMKKCKSRLLCSIFVSKHTDNTIKLALSIPSSPTPTPPTHHSQWPSQRNSKRTISTARNRTRSPRLPPKSPSASSEQTSGRSQSQSRRGDPSR